jgi:hypothetical protein
MKRSALPGPLMGGIVRLAMFNPAGFASIGNSREAFLSSLTPLIAFLIVGTTLESLGGGWRSGVGDGLQTLCILLGQPVVSNFYARWFKREEPWLRYATAMNWCQLAIPLVAIAFLIAALMLGGIAPSPRSLAIGLIGAIFVYAALLNWFLAWRGLNLSAWRAALFVLLVTATLALVLAVPTAIRVAQNGAPPVPNIVT